ncbi:MAG: protein kinase domain-containing protein [Limisphaerales bacterium]
MNAETENRCPVCQATLPPHLAPNRCPRCLLRAGLAAPPPALPETLVVPDMPAQSRGFPQPGQVFGHYRIVRPLGEGGMGAVFEAEDLECGRRVALKVLVHRLDSPEARNRFFREGRLAASVNHPNSVYVYGTEEIAGIPVIAMELAPGGTLQGRVSSQGHLPPAEAVDCVLRCLEKDPDKRFRNYDELRAALLPYATSAPTPATLGWRFLEGIRADSSLPELVAALQPLLGRRPTVSRGRRLGLLGGSLAFPALCAVIAAVRFGLQASFLPADKELAALQECLVHYDLLCQPNIWFGPRPHAREREALELYIAGRFAPVITNKVSWERFRTRLSMNDHLRWQAEHILATHTNLPSKEALDAAAIAVRQIIGKSPEEGARESLQSLQKVTPLLAVRMIAYMNGLVFVVVPCLVASLLFRGGVLAFALGIAFVNRKGAHSSRLQVTGRNLFAWLPFILLPVVEGRLAAVVGLHGAILLTAGGAMCLAVISVSLPQRGLQDRLAGVWPVAR